MKRGQISLELSIVIIVVFIVFTVIASLSESGVASQENLSAQNQAKSIAFTAARDLAGLATLSESSRSTVLLRTQPIRIENPDKTETCTIRIVNLGADSTVSVELDLESDNQTDIAISRKTNIPAGFTVPLTTACGEAITVTKP